MHDPSTLAGSLTLPIPSKISKTRTTSTRRWAWPFVRVGGYELYFGHTLIDFWHEEPGGADSGTICKDRNLMTHVQHLRLRFPPLRRLRRRLFTTCEWCGQSGTRKQPVNVSRLWDRPDRGRWWHGERGLFHRECSTLKTASLMCVCETPDEGQMGRCRNCGCFVDYRHTTFREARLLARRIGRGHHRPTAWESELIDSTFQQARRNDND